MVGKNNRFKTLIALLKNTYSLKLTQYMITDTTNSNLINITPVKRSRGGYQYKWFELLNNAYQVPFEGVIF